MTAQAPPRPIEDIPASSTIHDAAAHTRHTAPGGIKTRVDPLQQRAVEVMRRVAPQMLRVSLAITFLWFGALKVAGIPTLPGALIAAILPAGDPAVIVPAIGAAEAALGLWLVVGWRMPLALLAVAGHLAGTFLVLAIRPDVAFQGGNPLLLSVEGEFVMKNLVLLSAALLLAAYHPARKVAVPE